MGRIFGRKPDRTAAIGRAARRHLRPGEEVVAGVDVQRPGTLGAALSGGVGGAVTGAVGNTAMSVRGDSPETSEWLSQARRGGISAEHASKFVWGAVALTTSRLIVFRRSRLTRRLQELVAEWPVEDIERIEVPRRRQQLTVVRDRASLRFELAFPHRFRPAVYDELGDRLNAVKAELDQRSGSA